MNKVAFLYTTAHPQDALANWVATIARHARQHEIELLLRTPYKDYRSLNRLYGQWPDFVFIIASGAYHPAEVNEDLGYLKLVGARAAVIHAEDWGIPVLARYPSFCWTRTAQKNLVGYDAMLVPQPVLPRLFEAPSVPLHAGTFGSCEPKKMTLHMARRLRQLDIPFTVFVPQPLTEHYKEYIGLVDHAGAEVVIHPWLEKVEDLNNLFFKHGVSHFLFCPVPSKGGTGGCMTSPRYATAFGRPIVVIDNEIAEGEGFNTIASLDLLDQDVFDHACLPTVTRTPDVYLDELCQATARYYRANR
jgi:hypothetical protein